MSPKDSPFGKLPSLTFYDVISEICTSMHTYGDLKDAQDRIEREGISPETQIDLALNLWDDTMDAATEFRVFVPPPAARGIIEPRINDFKISAFSRYRWYAALNLPFEVSVQWVADRVIEGAGKKLANIYRLHGERPGYRLEAPALEAWFYFRYLAEERRKGSAHRDQHVRGDERLRGMPLQLGLGRASFVGPGRG